MSTTVDEIADGIYRLSTWVPDIAPPAGFTFNQFLIAADEPLLFHTGPRAMFPLVSEAIGTILPIERLCFCPAKSPPRAMSESTASSSNATWRL